MIVQATHRDNNNTLNIVQRADIGIMLHVLDTTGNYDLVPKVCYLTTRLNRYSYYYLLVPIIIV